MDCQDIECIRDWFEKYYSELIVDSTETSLTLKWSVKVVEFTQDENLYVRADTENEVEGYVDRVSVEDPEDEIPNYTTDDNIQMLRIEFESGEVLSTSFA